MASFEDIIQGTSSVFGDIDRVVSQGLEIFNKAKGEVFTTKSAPVPVGTPEPIASRPIVTGTAGFGTSGLVVAAIVIAYLLVARK